MKFASLGSGSQGNATLVEAADTCLLVDCGFSMRETVRRLDQLQRSPDQLSAIVVTHEHGDHIKGVMPLARKYQLPVYLTAGTAKAVVERSQQVDIRIVRDAEPFTIGALRVQPVAVPHDAREPVQYLFYHGNLCLGVLTDLGSVTPYVTQCYQHCDGLLLECNHDLQMLASGPYPASLKQRVSGPWGHLNNHQSADLLSQLECSRLQHLVLGHISLQNNCLERVREAVTPQLSGVGQVHYACQDEGFGWLQL
ncbi:MBL fold metallo-hydrolase [Porticoccus sp. W117]|uniref:MBL fold metallo-hydrolase n=1 Tax=Porticoccus sp. W117 TaxID=3054777 RepID=UPI0025940942|nr:MBL fold metallo-hydrolase [Porticoccus sp. W117]MDM3872228.1 MBL fold metallo-hydrolase [Porticoccus sp. W117]